MSSLRQLFPIKHSKLHKEREIFLNQNKSNNILKINVDNLKRNSINKTHLRGHGMLMPPINNTPSQRHHKF